MSFLPTIKQQRKGSSLSGLWTAGLAFVMVSIVLALGAMIVSQMKNQTTDATALTVLNNGLDALGDLSGWLPMIGLAIAGVIILGLIVRAFGGMGGSAE